jgi:hypothetical protein
VLAPDGENVDNLPTLLTDHRWKHRFGARARPCIQTRRRSGSPFFRKDYDLAYLSRVSVGYFKGRNDLFKRK